MEQTKTTAQRASFITLLSVASVLFGWHAGGGFATGNQANQFYVVSGWLGPISAVLAIVLLTLTVRQAMIMYNLNGLSTYKELFEYLYHPLDKLELVFEIYFYIMVLMATSASIAGAGTLFESTGLMSQQAAVVLVSVLLLVLTMFGAGLVRKVSTIMSVLILICALSIFIMGILHKAPEIRAVYTGDLSLDQLGGSVLRAFQYAGFQCAAIPTMINCGAILSHHKECRRAMWISCVMNALALCLSVFVLLGWQSVYTAIDGGTTIPTLTICKEMGVPVLVWAYYICLLLCFLSTGVTSVFGFVSRFEKSGLFMRIANANVRRGVLAVAVMGISMLVSFAGLTNIIKYGYGYCGYVGIAIIVVPFLTVGVYKNRKKIRSQT